MWRFTFLTWIVCFCLSIPLCMRACVCFVCLCLTLAATNVISSAWCHHLTPLKVTSFVASFVMWLVILSMLLAGKRTLEFYQNSWSQETKKEDQEKVLRVSSWKFAKNEIILLVIQWWSTCKKLLLIYMLQIQGTNLFSLEHRPLSGAKSCHCMILTANFMHSHTFACFPHLFSPCPFKLLCFSVDSTFRICYSLCNSSTLHMWQWIYILS